jgi:hypothetical protein
LGSLHALVGQLDKRGQVMRGFVVPRGITVLADGVTTATRFTRR